MAKHGDMRDEDWRLQGITTVQNVPPDSTIDAKPGDILKIVVPTIFHDRNVALGLPNSTALFLDLSQRMFKQAESNREEELRKKEVRYIKEKSAFSFFEKTMASIIFAFNALEAFANEEIPDDHVHYKKWKKLYVAQSKPIIERWVSLDVKLGTIIPQVFNIPSPKGTSTWTEYMNLKELRDRIIHLKTQDQRALAGDPPSIWAILFTREEDSFALIAKRIIGYFYSKTEKPPRWYEPIPF